jgi:membrane associated rhomboid family serine protease
MMGLLVGYFVINWRGLNFLPVCIRLKLMITTLMIVVLAVIFTLGQENISYLGHLGGFLAGLWLSGVPCSIVSKLR